MSSQSNRYLIPRVRRCTVNLPAKVVTDDIHPITKAKDKLRPSGGPDINRYEAQEEASAEFYSLEIISLLSVITVQL